MTLSITADTPNLTAAPRFPEYPHPIKMVVCDLDGTLVQSDLAVSEAVMSAIADCTQAGIKVVIATGRMYPSAQPYVIRLGLDTPVICYQGAVVKESVGEQTVRYMNPVPVEVARKLVDYCQAQDIHINVYLDDVLYSRPHDVYVREYQNTSSIEPTLVEDLLDILHSPPPKMVIINNNPQVLEAMKETLGREYGEDMLSWCNSRHNFLEVTAPKVSKWSAVVALAKQYGIAPEEVMCLGDEENDLSMLIGEGLGLAMANGPLHIQAQAKGTVPSIMEDGAAQAMHYYALKTPAKD
jgi:Cof subfamily protein (haloacid dehalogenase superfamily)